MSIFPTKILLSIDGSREATLAAQTAAKIADETGSELHMVYVRPRRVPLRPGDYVGPEVAEHRLQREGELLEREGRKLLDAQVEEIKAAGSSMTQTHFRVGKPDIEIVALGEELEAGLIVVGSRGRGGVRRALMGSVCDSVVRHAHCPVLVVRQEKSRQQKRGAVRRWLRCWALRSRRSQLGTLVVSLSTVGTLPRFNRYDERCRQAMVMKP